jgi:hypothetical protein
MLATVGNPAMAGIANEKVSPAATITMAAFQR